MSSLDWLRPNLTGVDSPGILLVRADVSPRVGAGHVMRSLALAQAWTLSGHAAFLTIDPPLWLRNAVEASGVSLVELDVGGASGSSADLRASLQVVAKIAGESSVPPWVCLDGYGFTGEYQQAVRELSPLLVIDDYAHLPWYTADVILNQNLGADALEYATDTEPLWLLGPSFALLRQAFTDAQSHTLRCEPQARRVLVTFGAVDPHNVTQKVLSGIEGAGIPDVEVAVVVGAENENWAELSAAVACSALRDRIELVRDASMPNLMRWADIAVSAAGSTCWELCFCGVPQVIIETSENQRIVAAGLEQAHGAVNLGWHGNVSPESLANSLRELARNADGRAALSQHGRDLVDGRGADRVVSVLNARRRLISALGPHELRLAKVDDLGALFTLANDPQVRASSISSDPIPMEDHLRWFAAHIESRSSAIWVLMVDGKLAAQVRYEVVGASAEIDFAVADTMRGRGIGTALLSLTLPLAASRLRVDSFRAIVLAENPASVRAFQRNRFLWIGSETIGGRSWNLYQRHVSNDRL